MAINHPSGNSAKERKHLIQGLCNPAWDFHKYNYAENENMSRYGSITAPAYDLSQIENNIMIVYGLRDTVTVPEDVEKLIQKLPSLPKTLLLKNYNHLDVIIGKTVRDRVNINVLKFFQ